VMRFHFRGIILSYTTVRTSGTRHPHVRNATTAEQFTQLSTLPCGISLTAPGAQCSIGR
jgi:hypothetical protein